MANSLNQDLKGKTVIVKVGPYRTGATEEDRAFVCEGGSGCSSFTMGRAIFGYFVKSGAKARIEGYDVEKLAEQQATTDE